MQIDKSKLRTSDGSTWDGNSIIDGGITPTEITIEEKSLLVGCAERCEAALCSAVDALAVIRANGLDPEYTELNRLREFLLHLGYNETEVERIANGNEIESDHICPQTLSVQVELDSCRSENEALAARGEVPRGILAKVYDNGFHAGCGATEKAFGLNWTLAIEEYENPYRSQVG